MSNIVNSVYKHVLEYGIEIGPRGKMTKEITNICMSFKSHEWFINSPALPINMGYVKKELAWYIEGDKYDLSICDHAEIWHSCVDEDGAIQSNYGFYYNNQYEGIFNLLLEDPDTRRAVVSIYQPHHNYPGAPDVPCTLTMQFLIRNNMLHSIVNMRSQDLVYGLRNDLPAFQMFKLALANDLGIEPGSLQLSVGSAHIYEKHYDKVAATFDNFVDIEPPPFDTYVGLKQWLDQA